MSPAKTSNIMVDIICIRIIIVFEYFLSNIVYFVEIFGISLLKINLNRVQKIVILSFDNFILIEPIFNQLVEQVIFSYFNIKPLSKKNFSINSLLVMIENIEKDIQNS